MVAENHLAIERGSAISMIETGNRGVARIMARISHMGSGSGVAVEYSPSHPVPLCCSGNALDYLLRDKNYTFSFALSGALSLQDQASTSRITRPLQVQVLLST